MYSTNKLESSQKASGLLAQDMLRENRRVFDSQCQNSTNSMVRGVAQTHVVFLSPITTRKRFAKLNLTNAIMNSLSPMVKGQVDSVRNGDVWANVDAVTLVNTTNATGHTLALKELTDTFANSMSVQVAQHQGAQPDIAQVMAVIPSVGHMVMNSQIQNSRSEDGNVTNLLTNYRELDLKDSKANMVWRTRTGAVVPGDFVMKNKEEILSAYYEAENNQRPIPEQYPHVVEYTTLLLTSNKGKCDALLAVIENNRPASEASGNEINKITLRDMGDAYVCTMSPTLMLKNLEVAERKLDAARKGCYVQLPNKNTAVANHKCAELCLASAVAGLEIPEELEGAVTAQLALDYTIFIPA